jgi:lipopolysaccharide export system protein LptC
MRQNVLLIAVLLVVAGISAWQFTANPIPEDEERALPQETRDIDYRVQGFEVVRMTPDGQPAHRLRAATLWQFADDGTSELEQPRLTVFQADEPPWEVASKQAWMSADGSLALLTGDVLIERDGDERTPPTRLETSELRIQPRDDYAETDKPVRLETDRDWLEAVGMKAWLRPPSRIKFLSEVESFYVPR